MFSFIKRHVFVATVTILLVIIIATIAGRAAKDRAAAANAVAATSTSQVTLVSAATFRKGATDIAADGIIESRGQADLKSQSNAPVALVDVSIGQSVYPGQVILELQNSDIRAQLAQAEATLKLAQGQYYAGGISLQSAQQALIDKIKDAYLKSYDTLNTDVDPVLYNNGSNGSVLSTLNADSNLKNQILSARVDLTSALRDWKDSIDAMTVSTSSINFIAATTLAETNLNAVLNVTALLLQAINQTTATAPSGTFTSLSTTKAEVSAGQSTISTALSSLTTAATAFQNSNATQNSTAEAQISVAQAGVNNLEAQLEKTIIRSPTSGKVAALPLEVGELASPGTLLATVVGEGGLEVKAYASGDDLYRLKSGLPVSVDNAISGTIESVAPAVDPSTKKVEVVVSITNPSGANLVIGDHVAVTIHAASTETASLRGKPATYLLPIQDVKIVPGSAYVYTVDAYSKVVKNEVTLGTVQGDFVEITGGLTDDMSIITPVYEIDPGQTVHE